MSNFLTRTLTGIVYVAVLVGSVLFFKPYAFGLFILFLIVIGTNELYSLFPAEKYQPSRLLGISSGVILFAQIFCYSMGWVTNLQTLLLILPVIWSIFIVELYRKKEFPFQNIALTLLGIVYIALPLSVLYISGFIRNSQVHINQFDFQFILGYFILQWTSDTGAYLVGISIGKHPLFPRVSPKKSWEGFFGGIVFTLIIAWVVSMYFENLTLINWLYIAAIISIFGVLGDLIESLLKRSLNVKDSGTILPGHGGILDRFDSVIFSAPMVFIYLLLFS